MTENDADYLFALELHKRLNNNSEDSDVEEIDFKRPITTSKAKQAPLQIKRSNPRSNLDEDFLNRTQNLVHPQWETLDPTPDVQALFKNFDEKFFQSRLRCVTLEWSKRMYSCAGICYSKRNRYGLDVTIRLSEPLLKLRPRKDLVETMLHEMIHAYCFVLNIREGNGGHGPNFKKIMFAINQVAGTNITVYHTFHDEVELYKQHWWRCNGICQNRSPFFGYVKRTSNRAPGPNDQWWAAHQESCGGTFLKIKGPDKTVPDGKAKANKKFGKASAATSDIRKFIDITKSKDTSKNNTIKGPIKSNGGGTILVNPKTNNISSAFPPTSYPGLSSDPFNSNFGRPVTNPGGNLTNVRGLRDFASGVGGGKAGHATTSGNTLSTASDLTGRGYTLDSSKSSSPNKPDGQVDRNHLRNLWSKRFGDQLSTSDSKRRRISGEEEPSTKRDTLLIEDSPIQSKTNEVGNDWQTYDEDVMLKDEAKEVITISSSEDEDDDDKECTARDRPTPLTQDQRQTVIKQEIMDETVDLKDEDIILIDDEFNEDEDLIMNAAAEVADTSIIDEFFGEDTLLKEFIEENDVLPRSSHQALSGDQDIVTCPICQGKMQRRVVQEHLDGCSGIAIKIKPPKVALKKLSALSAEAKPNPGRKRNSSKDILRRAGYTEEDLARIVSDDEISNNSLDLSISSETHSPLSSTVIHSPEVDRESSNEETRMYRQRNLYKTTRQCPKCAEEVEETVMGWHIQNCGRRSNQRKTKSPKRVMQKCPICELEMEASEINDHLDECLAQDHHGEVNEDSRLYRQRNVLKHTRQCPKCAQDVDENAFKVHLGVCLKKK